MNYEYSTNPDVEDEVRRFNWAFVILIAGTLALDAGLVWGFAWVLMRLRGM